MTRQLPILFGRVFNTPLMVSTAKLDAFLTALPAFFDRQLPTANPENHGEPPTETRRQPGYSIADGVATLPVHGVLVRRAGQVNTQSSPLQSYEGIRKSLRTALSDPRVRGILLDIDSPGGESGGVLDLSRDIRTGAQQKPIWAIANDDAFSAAYVLAASASRIWATRTAGLGSIGVVALHTDQSDFDKSQGFKYSYVYSGARKIDGNPHMALSPEARARVQTEVDRLQGLLTENVSQHRSLPPEIVSGMDAGIYFGPEAITSRLADQIGTPDEAHGALASHVAPTVRRNTTMAEQEHAAAPEATAEVAPVAEPPVAEPNVVNFAAARREGTDYAVEVVELCIAAGHAMLGPELVRSGMTTEQVRKHLLNLRLQAAAAPITPLPVAHQQVQAAGPPLPKPITSRESFAALRRTE